MNIVTFDKDSSIFSLTRNDITVPFYYQPNSKDIWSDLKEEDFIVIVLRNPFLNKERDVHEIIFDDSDERAGYVFPIVLLESEVAEGRSLLSYMFIAYKYLLSILPEEVEATGVISDCYSNASVLVVNKRTKPDFSLTDYLLSLASYGYYSYKMNINGENENFPSIEYLNNLHKTIRLQKCDVHNLEINYVKDLLQNRLCETSDFITRFVLVYQIIEIYISGIHRQLLDTAINKYKRHELNKNDFSEELKTISRESYQISELVKNITNEVECIDYIAAARNLFNEVGYIPKKENLDSLLYTLRNQIFHNFDMFVEHEDDLYQVVFSFERVTLLLLAKRRIIA